MKKQQNEINRQQTMHTQLNSEVDELKLVREEKGEQHQEKVDLFTNKIQEIKDKVSRQEKENDKLTYRISTRKNEQ